METKETKIEFPEFGELAKDEYAYKEVEKDSEPIRLKDRVLLKKMINVHRFTYQDIVDQVKTTERQVGNKKKEAVRVADDIIKLEETLDLWKKQRKEIEAAFPEIVEEETKLQKEDKAPIDSPEEIESKENTEK